MKTKKYWIWVIVSFSIIIFLWQAQRIIGETSQSAVPTWNDSNLTTILKLAVSTEPVVADDKEVLEGLEGVGVIVVDIKPEVEKYGLTEKALQTDTELLLRQYGIKVLTDEEWPSTPGQPFLCISVLVNIREKSHVAAAAISVELRESVLISREPKRICIGAVTWRRKGAPLAGLLRIKDLRGTVKDFVNEFINDYLAANPKDGSIKEKGSLLDDFKKRFKKPKDN